MFLSNRKKAPGIAAFLLLFPVLCMSQIHYHKIELEELVDRSAYVFVVKPTNPSYTIRKIKIDAALLKERKIEIPRGKKIPDYEFRVNRYEVVETLKGGFSGTIIQVLPPELRHSLESHILYYGIGLSESPIYFSYEASSPIDWENGNYILFANVSSKNPEDYHWTVHGAAESVLMKEKISELIRKQ
ncbi:hypothetical protein EHQ12_16550 [Leptospira gomenensis]|nr:hypothetical protein [Leptospira gomenensis]TGK34338.1 hypothetical protein EHQ12_16550 [Leptospira gomenensis]